MRISIPTTSYNPRRDGRPWVCRVVSWPVGGRAEVAWGSWYGSPGEAGELCIDANAGDVIRTGQNDMRGKSHTYRQYHLVNAGGTLTDLTDAEAAKLCQAPSPSTPEPENPLAQYSTEQLQAELARRTK